MHTTIFWVNDQKQTCKHKTWPMQQICLNTTESCLVINQHDQHKVLEKLCPTSSHLCYISCCISFNLGSSALQLNSYKVHKPGLHHHVLLFSLPEAVFCYTFTGPY